MTPDNILNVFIRLMARSTWIRTVASFLDLVTAILLRRFPCEKEGMFSVAPLGRSRCLMLKTRSAITPSFLSIKLTKIHLFDDALV